MKECPEKCEEEKDFRHYKEYNTRPKTCLNNTCMMAFES
jgi:hypothetical protein